MRPNARKPFSPLEIIVLPVKWHHTGDPIYPYQTKFNGIELKIRINDFPEKELYTLMMEDEELMDMENWPEQWIRPSD